MHTLPNRVPNPVRVEVEERDIIVNNPSELIVQIPALIPGKYRLVISNQYAVGAVLKEPRSAVFDKLFTVG